MNRSLALVPFLVLPALSAQAAAPELPALLREHRAAISLDSGRLAGPGAEVLREAALRSRFVVVGEDHGIAEIAAFSTALFEELAGAGYRTLVVEDGPAVAAALRQALREPDPVAAVRAFARRYPFSVAFYDMKEESELLARTARAAGPGFDLWGIDQELMGASRYLLDRIAAEPIGADAKARVAKLLEEEAAAYRKSAETGDPSQLFMMTVRREELDALRASLRAPAARRALELLDGLTESREIYLRNMDGRGYESNVRRARLMKRTLAAKLGGGDPPKLLVKIGAFHAFRGINPLGSREVGNYLAETAEAAGADSLHVLVLAAHGKQLAFAGIGRPPRPQDIGPFTRNSKMAGAMPLIEAAGAGPDGSLFDLRPMRAKALDLSGGDPEVPRVLLGFDFAVIIPEGTPSH